MLLLVGPVWYCDYLVGEEKASGFAFRYFVAYELSVFACLTLSALETKTYTFTNSVVPDETARNDKCLNYLQTVEPQIGRCALSRLILVCTVASTLLGFSRLK